MPRWMLATLFAVFALAIVAVVALFLRTGPLNDQARSPDVPTPAASSGPAQSR